MYHLKVQYDDVGNHRVVTEDGPGQWALYESPAFSRDESVIHLTEFYGERLYTSCYRVPGEIPFEEVKGHLPDAWFKLMDDTWTNDLSELAKS